MLTRPILSRVRAGALTALAVTAGAAIVLHRMRRGRAWASVAALVLVVVTGVSGSLTFEAGLAPGREVDVAAEPPMRPAPVPSGVSPPSGDETPRDPTGTWAVPGTGAYVRVDTGGALALSDGCVEAVGTWVLDAEGAAVFTLPESPVSCDPAGSWVLLARSASAREGWIALRDADGADIGGLPRSG